MVEIQCKSNLDCFKRLKWPDVLPEVPHLGDLIRSSSSTNTKYIELEVVRRTWAFHVHRQTWVCEVELHLVRSRGLTIEQFERWALRS